MRSVVEALLKTEADTTIKTKDSNHSFNTMDDFPGDKDKFTLFFPTTKNKHHGGPSRALVVLHVTSAQNLESLKKSSTVLFKHLKQEKIWLSHHKFLTSRLQSIGFIADRSTVFTRSTRVEAEIKSSMVATIAEKLAANSPDNIIDIEQVETPPEFELTPRKIFHAYRSASSTRKIKVHTEAYEIRCESIHKNRLIVLLTSNSGDKERSGTFIPYSMAKSHPEGYGDQIRRQERYLQNLEMIAVYGLDRKAMESPTPDSDNSTFRGHLLDHQDCKKAADGSQTYEPMLLGIESTNKTDTHGKYMFLCTAESAARVKKWIDEQLPILYETATRSDPNHQTIDKTAFPAPSRGFFSTQTVLIDKYEADLRALLPKLKPTTDTQEDPAIAGGYTRKRTPRSTKTRKPNEIKLVYDSSDCLFPTLSTPGSKGYPAQAPVDKNTYSARTAASTTPSPSANHATGNIHHNGGDSTSPKNNADDLRRRVEENDAKIAALVAAAKHQDETIEKMQAIHKQTQATVESLIAQISALVALISRDHKPANEDKSHTLTITSNNKRNSTDSPQSSPSEKNRTSKRFDDSDSPYKRLFQGFSRISASTSTVEDASNHQSNPD